MDTNKIYTSAAGAAKDYFGAESAQKFMQEWKELSAEEKEEIKNGLEKIGYQFSSAPAPISA